MLVYTRVNLKAELSLEVIARSARTFVADEPETPKS